MVNALEGLLAAHTTVVIATHEVDFALGWADTVAVLVDGQVRHGLPTDLLGDAGLVAAARLRQPLVLQAAALLGLDHSGVRNVTALVQAVRCGAGDGAFSLSR
jgi:cobalt/nickel transport system ATP-binding protein